MSKKKFDFSGWATRNDVRCSDGRTIRKNAFEDDDGRTVPLVWMHQHDDPMNVLGHALLENRADGVYAYCSFNDSQSGVQGKTLVAHGDVASLSIWANNLKQDGGDVLHGSIKEVSVVLAGANPGAIIDYPVLAHGEESTTEAYIRMDMPISLVDESLEHSDDKGEEPEKDNLDDVLEHGETVGDVVETMNERQYGIMHWLVETALSGKEPEGVAHISHADGTEEDLSKETVEDVINSMNEKQKAVCRFLVNKAMDYKEPEETKEDAGSSEKEVKHSDNESEEEDMPKNVFEQFGKNAEQSTDTLSHADGMRIVELAKANGGMSLQAAINLYAEENEKELHHSDDDLGFKDIATLFPDYELMNGPTPETLDHDTGWVGTVLRKVHKVPKNRLRVRFADKRDITGRRAQGYTKGTQKQFLGNLKLLGRTVDPTTVYSLDHLNRDDIIDITDFNLIDYMYRDQRGNLEEELARQILIGDGRNGAADDDDGWQPIDGTKIIPIWGDDELFAIHAVLDVDGTRDSLTGTENTAYFGDSYVWAESVIQTMLYARENYKGSGSLDFYCTPHLVNVMLLARDMNGRRIYDNVNDLKAAMNINDLVTVEQFAGKTRTVTVDGAQQTRRLLGIMVNLKDYAVGAAKGGEITHFTDFDIRFNQNLSLLETRLSGMLARPFSAIVLEEIVTPNT